MVTNFHQIERVTRHSSESLRGAGTDPAHRYRRNLFTFPDGSARWFDIRVEPVEEGICVYSFDIHDRKLAQLVLERRNAELESRLPLLRRIMGRRKGP